jgi:hypothetical protein
LNNEAFWTGMPGILTALAGVIAAVGTLIGVLHTTGILRRKGPGGGGSGPIEDRAPEADTPTRGSGETTSPVATSALILRSAPAILSGEKMSAMLVRRDFFDKRRNPSGSPPGVGYDTRVDGEMLMVVDSATGLTWEMGGSDRPMRFDEARLHMDRLNERRAGGSADWRLPTAEEAMSLMQRLPVDGFHISPDFRRGVNFVWTADLLDDGARAWVVYYADGTVEAESKDFNAWVRAVR